MQRGSVHCCRQGKRWTGTHLPKRLKHPREDLWESLMRWNLEEASSMNIQLLASARSHQLMPNALRGKISSQPQVLWIPSQKFFLVMSTVMKMRNIYRIWRGVRNGYLKENLKACLWIWALINLFYKQCDLFCQVVSWPFHLSNTICHTFCAGAKIYSLCGAADFTIATCWERADC